MVFNNCTVIWANENGLVSSKLACKIYLDLNFEFPIQFAMYLQPKKLKSERNNPCFKPRFGILLPDDKVSFFSTWDL